MDAERVAQRALDLHEKASMPLAEALQLALDEASGPIWPCAKLVIRNGVVCVSSHQYAPGLPDGEHDVYPLPVDADACPSGVAPCGEAHQQLMKFYAVTTLPALVEAQAKHIEKLQAKLPPTPSFAPHRVREG
jgi:hypothetical protein